MEYVITKSGGSISGLPRDIFTNLKDGKYKLSVKRITNRRSNDQNRYYWACLGLIATEVGYVMPDMSSPIKSAIVDELHEIMKEKYLGATVYKQKDKRRKKIKIPRSSATLDTAEFTKYVNDIRRDYPFLPDPEDRNIDTFYSDYYWR